MLEATSPTSRAGPVVHRQSRRIRGPARGPSGRSWEMLAAKFAEEGLIAVPPEFWHEDDTLERRLARKRAGAGRAPDLAAGEAATRERWRAGIHRPRAAGKAGSAARRPNCCPRADARGGR